MNEIILFKNTQFGEIRTIGTEQEPLFCLSDLCKILELTNPSSVSKRIDADDKIIIDLNLGRDYQAVGNTKATFVRESGLYEVIFMSSSPKVRPFRKWITKDVLPSIRKHGMYATDELVNNPDLLIQVATKLKEERAARQLAESKAQMLEQVTLEQAPKVEFYNAVTDSKDCIDMASAAKVLNMGVGRNKLFEILRNNKILMGNNSPFQKYVDAGYFKQIEVKFTKPNGDTCINIKTVVYQKGLDAIRRLLTQLQERQSK